MIVAAPVAFGVRLARRESLRGALIGLAVAGDKITLTGSVPDEATKQGDEVSVPDVKGKSEADAKSTLEKAGFLVTVSKQNSGDVSGGQAFKTDPAAGQKLGKGKKITLYVKP